MNYIKKTVAGFNKPLYKRPRIGSVFSGTLKNRIMNGIFIVLFIMFIATIWSIYNFYRLNESFKITIRENYTSIESVDNLILTIDNQQNRLTEALLKSGSIKNTIDEESKGRFFYWYSVARSAAYTQEEKILLDSISQEYSDFLTLVNKSSDNNSEIKINNLTDFLRYINSIKTKCSSILDINHLIIREAVKNSEEITRNASIFIVFTVGAGIFLSILFANKFSDFLLKPLNNLTASAKSISEGKFDRLIEIEDYTDDYEITQLTREFNHMISRLREYEELNLSKIFYEKKKADLVLENINEPVLVLDSNFEIILSNTAFNTINNRKHILDEIIKIFSAPGAGSAGKQFPEITIKPATTVEQMRYYRIIHSEINIPGINTTGLALILNDITSYKEIDRLKSEFIGKVSHELKTPLTSLGMAVGMMEDKVAGDLTPIQSQLLTTMKSDYIRLSKLVNEILELTRIESGELVLDLSDFNPASLLDELERSFRLISQEKGVSVNFSSSLPDKNFRGNYKYILRALENIVSNSLKFTPAGGIISVNLSYSDNNLIADITDSGIGMQKDVLSRIFDKFVQINDSIPGSVGLGLSIAKEAIEAHKGKITVESKPGEGTRFMLEIPYE